MRRRAPAILKPPQQEPTPCEQRQLRIKELQRRAENLRQSVKVANPVDRFRLLHTLELILKELAEAKKSGREC